MVNKLPSTNLIVSNWPKWQSLNHHNLTKNDRRRNIFSKLSSRQQYGLNDITNPIKNGYLMIRNVTEKKPTPSRNIPLLSIRKSDK